MQRPSDAYWAQRALERMDAYHTTMDKTMARLIAAYNKVTDDIYQEIVRIFRTFGRNAQLTPQEAWQLLQETVGYNEWLATIEPVKQIKNKALRRKMLTLLSSPAYAARISRLQALQTDVYIKCKLLADQELAYTTDGYMQIIDDAYYRTIFDIQQGIGVSYDFASMPTHVIKNIVEHPWSGTHFSERIWRNTDVLAQNLNEVITAGFMSGASTKKMRDQIAERMDVGMHAANRLMRTETTYVANRAEMESYKDAELEQYKFIATLDSRTSPQCRSHDGKVYNVEDATPGKNMPPLHPYCRSTTIAYFDDAELDALERRARDPETGRNYVVPPGTTYENWRSNQTTLGNEREHPHNSLNKFKVSDFINTSEYRSKFDKISDNPIVNEAVYRASIRMLSHRDGTEFEDYYLINRHTGRQEAVSNSFDIPRAVPYNKVVRDVLRNADDQSLISIHNHPGSSPPSLPDFNALASTSKRMIRPPRGIKPVEGVPNGRTVWRGIVVGHEGNVFIYSKPVIPIPSRMFDAKFKKYKYSGYSDYTCHIKALEELSEQYKFTIEEL